MSYVLAGRSVKKEHLTLGVYAVIGGLIWASTGGKKTEMAKPAKGQTPLQAVKESVPLNAGSSEEEQLVDSIRKYIAEAEKEGGHSGH